MPLREASRRGGSTGLFVLAVLLLLPGAGCPQHPKHRPLTDRAALPALEWTVQVEGNPWPYGIVGDTLLVWSYRQALDGFLFPIQLAAYAPSDGKNIWNAPIRPWLLDRNVPWSFVMAQAGTVVGAWVKGDVVRALRSADGVDAWSLPRCRGLLAVGETLWAASEKELIVLGAERGRERRRIQLPARIAEPPALAGGRILVLLEGQTLVAVVPATGKIAWSKQLTTQPGRVVGRPQAAGDLVLVPHQLPTGDAQGAALVAHRASNGAAIWEARIPTAERPKKVQELSHITVAGDLVIWPQRKKRCFRILSLITGKERFKTCDVHDAVPPVRWGQTLYLLGDDPKSRAALKRGDPWFTVDYPLLAVNVSTGRTTKVTAARRRRRKSLWKRRGRARKRGRLRQIRALRLSRAAPIDGVVYLLQRNKFITALRVGWPKPASTTNP